MKKGKGSEGNEEREMDEKGEEEGKREGRGRSDVRTRR